MKKIHFQNLLRNTPLEKLIFQKFFEETEFAGKQEQAKI